LGSIFQDYHNDGYGGGIEAMIGWHRVMKLFLKTPVVEVRLANFFEANAATCP